MSLVEDVRQVLQDFLAPELRALNARLDTTDKVIDLRFKEIESRFKEVDSRFNEVSVRLKSLQETIDRNDQSVRQLITNLAQQFEFEKRLSEIERQLAQNKSAA